jgi:hypothetical protein
VMDWKVKHKALCGKDIPADDPYTLICEEMDAFVTNVANPPDSRRSVEVWRANSVPTTNAVSNCLIVW